MGGITAFSLPSLTYGFLLVYGYREGHLSREDILNYVVALLAPIAILFSLAVPMAAYVSVFWLIFLVLLLMFKCELTTKLFRPP